jgi:hypothetical protein
LQVVSFSQVSPPKPKTRLPSLPIHCITNLDKRWNIAAPLACRNWHHVYTVCVSVRGPYSRTSLGTK